MKNKKKRDIQDIEKQYMKWLEEQYEAHKWFMKHEVNHPELYDDFFYMKKLEEQREIYEMEKAYMSYCQDYCY